MNNTAPEVENNDGLCALVLNYAEYADTILNKSIHDKKEEHPFWRSSRERQLQQLSLFENIKKQYDELCILADKMSPNKENEQKLLIQLEQLFLLLANSIPKEASDINSWRETISVCKKLMRLFLSNIVAHQPKLFNKYVHSWSEICHERNIQVPYVQFNIIGLINSLSSYDADHVKIYLENLNKVNWDKAFEIVFTKKLIRDRLFKIATIFIEHAGSIDQLKPYLISKFNDEHIIQNLANIYKLYLNGIERKLEILKITYPEFTFENISHPAREDVNTAEQRKKIISEFIAALSS